MPEDPGAGPRPPTSTAGAVSAPEWRTRLAFAGIVILGGANFVAVRFSNRELDPFWGAGLRFALAAMILLWVVLLRRFPLPRGRALTGATLFGGTGIGASYALAYWGMQEISAGLASVVVATTPLLTLLLAVAQKQERFRLRPLLGGIIAATGIALVVWDSLAGAISLPHLVAVVGMGFAFAQSAIIARAFPSSHPVAFNAVAMATGATILLLFALVAGESWRLPERPAPVAAFVYLVASSCALFTLVLYVVRRWDATSTNYTMVLMPLVAVTGSALLEDVPVGPVFFLQAVLVLGGTWIGIGKPRAKTARPPALPAP